MKTVKQYKKYVGKKFTEEIEREFKDQEYRVLRGWTVITADFKPSRINIIVNERNVITAITAG